MKAEKADNLVRSILSIFRGVGIVLVTTCFIFTGCTLIKLKEDNKKSLESTVIVGRIHGKFDGSGPIIVAARSLDKGKQIAHYTVLHESGEYELMVDQGKYHIFAYQDRNSDLIYEANEPAGQYGDPTTVRATGVGVVPYIDIAIPPAGGKIKLAPGTQISEVKPDKLYSRQAGDITTLDDRRFNEEYGGKGFWEPLSFFKEMGGNIFFLEKYDPQKTPILFIHGATGTPRGWRYIINRIDRTRFQPWFFYYPTGARIDSMSNMLSWKLSNLQSKYQFNKLYLTAHSMGGLVARSFIINYGRQLPYVKLFISLATPWGGDKMAEYGVEQSPVVIPSWIDMQPNGDFISSIYRTKMPESIDFYMFSGHKGSHNPFRSNNDGTITLSSILDYRPQAEAKMNYVFNEDHTSILFSKEVSAQYNAILDAYDSKQSAFLTPAGGHLKIHFDYAYEYDGVRPQPVFILRPAGKKDMETAIVLNDYDNGRVLGPFPTGNYTASMVTLAAKPEKNDIPVAIESDKTKELDFVFTPDGEIRGCVTASLDPEDKSPGRPDYTYRLVDSKISIKSIVLEGNGIHRALVPKKGIIINNYDFFISRDDICYSTCYGFFGLPAGDYSLFIEAEGYRPIEKKYSITPGAPQNFRPTELTAE